MKRAFSNKKVEYYKLLQDIPCVPKGAIFYWDKDDEVRGSIAAGCLKLCWTPDGHSYSPYMIIADTVVFHASATLETGWFKEISKDKWKKEVRKFYKKKAKKNQRENNE